MFSLTAWEKAHVYSPFSYCQKGHVNCPLSHCQKGHIDSPSPSGRGAGGEGWSI
jgi:hypothetical protein